MINNQITSDQQLFFPNEKQISYSIEKFPFENKPVQIDQSNLDALHKISKINPRNSKSDLLNEMKNAKFFKPVQHILPLNPSKNDLTNLTRSQIIEIHKKYEIVEHRKRFDMDSRLTDIYSLSIIVELNEQYELDKSDHLSLKRYKPQSSSQKILPSWEKRPTDKEENIINSLENEEFINHVAAYLDSVSPITTANVLLAAIQPRVIRRKPKSPSPTDSSDDGTDVEDLELPFRNK